MRLVGSEVDSGETCDITYRNRSSTK